MARPRSQVPLPSHERLAATRRRSGLHGAAALASLVLAAAGCVELGFRTRLGATASAPVDAGTPAVTNPPPVTRPPVVDAGAEAPTPPPVDVAMAGPTVALGEHHTCLLGTDGRVRCAGYNREGQLGIGTAVHPGSGEVRGIGDTSDGPVRSLAAGGYQTCALLASGRVACWGQNHEGQVGSGDATDAPVRSPVIVRGLDDVAQLALGDTTSCAVTRSHALFCWGDNAHRQIDDSSSRRRLAPTRVPGFDGVQRVAVGNHHLCGLVAGRVRCRGSLARTTAEAAALEGVTEVSSGWEHACALRAGRVACWGRSYLGGLGRGRMCPEGTSSTCDADTFYPPTEVPGVVDAVALATHDYHSCVRRASGEVVCWGNNQGHAFADDLPAEPWQTAHPVASLGSVDALFVGGLHVCGFADGVLRCRGAAEAGVPESGP